jgi:hypothetical protein
LVSHTKADLTEGEKQMLDNLLRAAAFIEELHMLQIHPKNLEWRDDIFKSGTGIEKKIFTRYQSPFCAQTESVDCSALAAKPGREIGTVHWPTELADREFRSLSRQINGRELLSPFTVVARNESKGFDAIPYGRTEVFGSRMKEVAEALRAAAQTAPHKSLKTFLSSRAIAFESGSAFPYDASDYDWIGIKGDWEVTVGPYETDGNPRRLKALFTMFIGKKDEQTTGELVRLEDSLQDVESALSELVGVDIYQRRKGDPRVSIRAVDIWMACGHGRRGGSPDVTYQLPIRGKSVKDGLTKKVMMVNHAMAYEAVYQARAEVLLHKDQLGLVDIRSDIANMTSREIGRGMGSHPEIRIKSTEGKMLTVKEALKEHESLIDALKADVLGLWLLQFQKSKGWIDENQEKRRYTAAIVYAVGSLQNLTLDTNPQKDAVALGWFMDEGAVNWDAVEGRFEIDFKKMPIAVESLAKKLMVIQLTGDYDQAAQLVNRYIIKKGKSETAIRGALGNARAALLDKFNRAGIKSPSLRYEVTE